MSGLLSVVVPYPSQQRFSGKSSWSLLGLFNYGVKGILAFNERLVRVATQLGMLAIGAALLYVIYLVVAALVCGIEAPGYITTIPAVVGMGGVQLVFLGVLGEYVGKTSRASSTWRVIIPPRRWVAAASPST